MAGDKPPVVAAKDASGLKYRMAEVADAKEFMPSLKEFLTQLEAGNLEPYLKSEAIPDNSANAVKVAVAKNFDDLVMKSEKDVLVEFYAPWYDLNLNACKFVITKKHLWHKFSFDLELLKVWSLQEANASV